MAAVSCSDLFIVGEKVEIIRKKVAREAADHLFDEIIDFRNKVAPTGSQDEKNETARQIVIELRTIGPSRYSKETTTQEELDSDQNKNLEIAKSRNSPIELSPPKSGAAVVSLSDLSSQELEHYTTAVSRAPGAFPARISSAKPLSSMVITEESGSESFRVEPKTRRQFREQAQHALNFNRDERSTSVSSDIFSSKSSSACSLGLKEAKNRFAALRPNKEKKADLNSEYSSDECPENSENRIIFPTSTILSKVLERPWDQYERWDDGASAAHSLISNGSYDQELIEAAEGMYLEESPSHGTPLDPFHPEDDSHKNLKEKDSSSPLKKDRCEIEYLTRNFLELFLGDLTEDFMKHADRGCKA